MGDVRGAQDFYLRCAVIMRIAALTKGCRQAGGHFDVTIVLTTHTVLAGSEEPDEDAIICTRIVCASAAKAWHSCFKLQQCSMIQATAVVLHSIVLGHTL